MSVSVCLSMFARLSQKTAHRPMRGLGSVLLWRKYVTYFRFCGWRHICL